MSNSNGPIYRFHTEAWWTVDINKVSYNYSTNTSFALRNAPVGKKKVVMKKLFFGIIHRMLTLN